VLVLEGGGGGGVGIRLSAEPGTEAHEEVRNTIGMSCGINQHGGQLTEDGVRTSEKEGRKEAGEAGTSLATPLPTLIPIHIHVRQLLRPTCNNIIALLGQESV
jgi:hypothetical protein